MPNWGHTLREYQRAEAIERNTIKTVEQARALKISPREQALADRLWPTQTVHVVDYFCKRCWTTHRAGGAPCLKEDQRTNPNRNWPLIGGII